MWARAVAANLTGPAAAVARRAISENALGGSSEVQPTHRHLWSRFVGRGG